MGEVGGVDEVGEEEGGHRHGRLKYLHIQEQHWNEKQKRTAAQAQKIDQRRE